MRDTIHPPAALGGAAGAPAGLRVALLGFSNFERSALVSYLRLSGLRMPAYRQAESLPEADYIVADADHAGTVDAVLGAGRVADTVFIGSQAPEGALAWMMRPIDPLQVFRELDATVAYRRASAAATAAVARPATPVPAPRLPPVPAAPQAAGPDAAAAPAAAARGAPASRRAGDETTPLSALLIDANEASLHLLERLLQGLGLRTETAPGSQRAVDLMAMSSFDLVFIESDLGPLSAQGGLELCQQIKREREPRDPLPLLVVVSSQATTTDRVRASFAGCDAFLAKPVDEEALRRGLRKLGLRPPVAGDSGYSSRPGAFNGRPAKGDGRP